MKSARWFAAATFAATALGCGAESPNAGYDQPLRIASSQFVEGTLPVGKASTGKRTVTAPSPSQTGFFERQAGIGFSGTTSTDVVAVGVAIHGQGTGYYLLPTGAVDAQDSNALTYGFVADLQASLPAGLHEIEAVGFDAQGKPGPTQSTELCVQSLRPDNGNACYPKLAPPVLVLSLSWDQAADLDLLLVSPTGTILSAKRPVSGGGSTGGSDPSAAGSGTLEWDSNAACVPDGRNREDVVFQGTPTRGSWKLYVNLFDSCKQPSVSYMVEQHVRKQLNAGSAPTYGVTSKELGAGVVVAEQANSSDSLGTYVATVTVK